MVDVYCFGIKKAIMVATIKPITAARFKHIDQSLEPDLWANIHRLARDVFLEFNLGSLIRIDVRADENGDLHILEANPKPDLKRPTHGVTSLISAGLSQAGLDYDDLILSLLADRLASLFSHRRSSASHIIELLDSDSLDLAKLDRELTEPHDTDAMVLALHATARQLRLHNYS